MAEAVKSDETKNMEVRVCQFFHEDEVSVIL